MCQNVETIYICAAIQIPGYKKNKIWLYILKCQKIFDIYSLEISTIYTLKQMC